MTTAGQNDSEFDFQAQPGVTDQTKFETSTDNAENAQAENDDDELEAEPLAMELGDELKKSKDSKVTLTDEELLLPPAERAMLLQRKLREQRLAREKEEMHLAEKKRIMSQKAMQESKQKLEELEARRAREQLEREKKEKREAEEKQRELLRLDYRERFGRELNEEEIAEQALAKKSSREQIKHWVGKLAVLAQKSTKVVPGNADESVSADSLAKCIKILIAYCDNASANPLAPKFLTISKTNKAYQDRVSPFPDGVKLLLAVGFRDVGDHLTIEGYPNTHALNQASDLLKHVQKTLA